MPDLHGSHRILICHLIQQGFCEPKNLRTLLGVRVGVPVLPVPEHGCVSGWVGVAKEMIKEC